MHIYIYIERGEPCVGLFFKKIQGYSNAFHEFCRGQNLFAYSFAAG